MRFFVRNLIVYKFVEMSFLISLIVSKIEAVKFFAILVECVFKWLRFVGEAVRGGRRGENERRACSEHRALEEAL